MQLNTKFWKQIFHAFNLEAGNHVLLATIISRLSAFIGAWGALQILNNEILGNAIFGYQIIIFILPFIGMGLYQGLLRFGAQLSSQEEKNQMFVTVLKKGFMVTLILSILVYAFSGFLTSSMPESQKYLQLFSIVLCASFLYEMLRTYFRIIYQNKNYAFTEVTNSLLFLTFVLCFSHFFGIYGYVLSFILAPLISFLIWSNKINFRIILTAKKYTISKDFWWYGIFASLGNVTTQLLFVIDILLIGILLHKAEFVTIYKYLTLIPFSVLFLSQVYMTTHFVKITKNINDEMYIKRFIQSYYAIFIIISIGFLLISWFFKSFILNIFDSEFSGYSLSFFTLCFGASGILLFRGLYGNLLSALGFANYNFIIALVGLGLNIVLNFYLIPIYGLQGAAITSATIMWLTALLSLVTYHFLRFRYKSLG